MKLFKLILPASAFLILFSACQQQGYQSSHVISNRRAKANVRYYKHQKEGLRLSSAATRYNVDYNDYQREGLRLSSQGY